MVAVDGIAAAGEVGVGAALGVDDVIDAVVQPAQRQGPPLFVPLAGVVEDHVEDHLDAGGVQGLDHLLEFAHLGPGRQVDRVGGLGGEKAQRMVAPEVVQRFPGQGVLTVIVGFVEFGDRQQFHGGDAKFLQVGDLFDYAAEGPRVSNVC